jgi:transcriptional regulator with XRE-family HTH domain
MESSSPAYRRLVGGALRRYREGIGYSLDDAAKVLECDRSKISRVETGQRGIRPKELRELLGEYSVSDAEQEALIRLSRRSRQAGWWDQYASVLPDSFIDYLILEETATEILQYEAQMIPDLLQIQDYARALADAEPAYTSDAQREDAVAARSERQAAVAKNGARLSVVLAEAALHLQVGGPDVMAEQLARLAEHDNVQVLPFCQGAHAASGTGPLTIVRLGDISGLGAVRVPDLSGGHCLTEPADVTRYVKAFTALRGVALPPEQSRQLIRDVAAAPQAVPARPWSTWQ